MARDRAHDHHPHHDVPHDGHLALGYPRVLRIALIVKAAMFVLELATGLQARLGVTAGGCDRLFREGDANMRSVWLCTRNDAIGNVAVLLVALGCSASAPPGRTWRSRP